jgi:hypothetical protein
MNIDFYQPHSAPQGSQSLSFPGGETLNSSPMIDIDQILLEVHHGAILRMKSAPPKSGKDLMTQVRSTHGQKEAHLKKATTVTKQGLLSKIRSELKMRKSLHHVTTKCQSDLMSQIRASRGGTLLMQIRSFRHAHHLRKTATRSLTDLLAAIRAQQNHPTPRLRTTSTRNHQALMTQMRSEHAHVLQPFQSILKEVKKHHIVAHLKKAATVAKQSLLSEVRAEHGCEKDQLHLLHATYRPIKSSQFLMSEVRCAVGGRNMLKKNGQHATVERQSLFSQLRKSSRGA